MNRDAWEAAIGQALERELGRRPDARACYDTDADYRLQLTVACDVLTTVAMSAEQTVHIPRDGVRQLLTDSVRRLVVDGADAARERERMGQIAAAQLLTEQTSPSWDVDDAEQPFCRWCRKVIHRASTGWLHADSARTPCADLQHSAEPAVTYSS